MSSDNENYDYTDELDDSNDILNFGMYKGLTPLQVAKNQKGRQYIIWAWKNTYHWIGSNELVQDVFEQEEEDWKPREPRVPKPPVQVPTVEDFEQAILDAYGAFPKPLWMY